MPIFAAILCEKQNHKPIKSYMKIYKYAGFGAVAALMFLTACNDGVDSGCGTGTIFPQVSYDSEVVSAHGDSGSRAAEIGDITVGDLTLSLKSDDGLVNESFPASEFPSDRQFPVGGYAMTASYGNLAEEGFEMPGVYGEACFSVLEGETTAVELTALPSKAMVSLTFDDALTGYMTKLSAGLHTPGGAYIDYASTETRPIYLKPGNVALSVSFTKPNGAKGSMEVTTFKAEARHHYHLKMNLGGNGVGSVESIVVTFDDNLQQQDVELDISDLVLSAPAPEVEAVGFANGERIEVIEGSAFASAPRFDIHARGGIARAVLTTRGESLIAQGWPAEIDLGNADASQQQALTSLGFKDMGLFRKVGNYASFSLEEVAAHIPASADADSPVEFTLVVTDRSGKMSEPVGFSVVVARQNIGLSFADGYAYAGEETIEVVVSASGSGNLSEALKMQYETDRGDFSDAVIAAITPLGSAANEYKVNVNVPADARIPFRLRAVCGSTVTEPVEVPMLSAPKVTVNTNDVFATHAWATVSATGYDPFSRNFTAEISTDGGKTYSAATFTRSGSDLHLTGLTPSSTVYLRVRTGALVSSPVTIRTEAAAPVENGEFDEWAESAISCGAYGGTNFTPAGPWDTLNSLTTSATNALDGRSYHIGTVPSDDAHSGMAGVVRTVGWKASGATPYNKQPENHTAGELYLGTYTNEGPSYGIPFTSRPSGLKFWAKFDKFNAADKGLVVIEVLDSKNNVIASGRLTPDNADYRQLTVGLTYKRNASKAASLRILFRSSDQETVSGEDVATLSTGLFVNHNQHATGASFYIDDVELIY